MRVEGTRAARRTGVPVPERKRVTLATREARSTEPRAFALLGGALALLWAGLGATPERAVRAPTVVEDDRDDRVAALSTPAAPLRALPRRMPEPTPPPEPWAGPPASREPDARGGDGLPMAGAAAPEPRAAEVELSARWDAEQGRVEDDRTDALRARLLDARDAMGEDALVLMVHCHSDVCRLVLEAESAERSGRLVAEALQGAPTEIVDDLLNDEGAVRTTVFVRSPH